MGPGLSVPYASWIGWVAAIVRLNEELNDQFPYVCIVASLLSLCLGAIVKLHCHQDITVDIR